MPAIQTTYTQNHRIGIVGQLADQSERNVTTRILEDLVALPFGSAVFEGITQDGCRTAANGGTIFLGVSVIDRTIPASVTSPDAIPSARPVPVLRKGCVYVIVETDVPFDAPAFVDHVTGLFTAVSAGNIAILNGYFETAALANGISRLRIV